MSSGAPGNVTSGAPEADAFARFAPLVAGVALALPVLVTRFPPMNDLATHEGTVGLLAHWSDTTFAPRAIYELNLGHPNQLYFLVAAPLAWLFGSTWATKLVAAGTIVALPLAAARLAGHLGTPRWTALLVAPLGLGWLFFWGLETNLLGLTAFLALLPVFDRYAAAPTARALASVAGGLALLYLAHEAMLLVAAGTLALFALLRGGDVRALAARLAPLPVVAAIVAAQLFLQAKDVHVPGASLVFAPLATKLRRLPEFLFGDYEAPVPALLLALVALVMALLARERWRTRSPRAPRSLRATLLDLRFEIVALALFVAYFALPRTLPTGATWIYHRALAPAYAIAVVRLAPQAARMNRERVRLAPILFSASALPLASLLLAWPVFVDAARIVSELDPLLPRVAIGSAFAVVDVNPGIPARFFHPLSLTGHVLAARGGRGLRDYTLSAVAPVHARPSGAWLSVIDRTFFDARDLRPSVDLERFRYLIVFAEDARLADATRAAIAPYARAVATNGRFTLFESTELTALPDAPDSTAPLPPDARTLKELVDGVLGRGSKRE